MGKSVKTKGAIMHWPVWLTQPLGAWMLVFFSVALYLNTLGHGYTLDDAIAIYDNEYTQKGISGIPDIWTHDSFRGFFKEEGKADLVAGGRYRPLSFTLFAIEYQIFGQNPLTGHLFNILWYALLILILFRWLGSLHPERFPWQTAWLVALLFMAHPLHVEVVANIKGRDEILCLLLSILSARYFMKNGWLSAPFLFLALTAKEMALTALIWIPMAYMVFRELSLRDALTRSLPLWAGFAAYMVLRISVLGFNFGGEASGELMNNPFLHWNGQAMEPFTTGERIASVLTIFSEYIRLLVFPADLVHDYYPASLPVGSWTDPRAWFGLLTLVSLGWIALRNVVKPNVYTWTAAAYLAGFALIGNVLFPIGTFMGERFLFMPSLFFVIALVFFLNEKIPGKAFWIIAVLFAGYALRTVTRNPVWESDERLFLHDVKIQTESAKLRNAAAGALLTRIGKLPDPASETRSLTEAVGHLEKALSIHPLYKNAWLQLGNARFYQQEFRSAEEAYLQALRIDPDYSLAEQNLSICYREYGKQLGEKEGRLVEAIQVLKKAVELRQDDPETFRLLGVAYGVSGRLSEALAQFEKVVALDPDNADGWYNMGVALMQSGRKEEGERALQKARELDPIQYK